MGASNKDISIVLKKLDAVKKIFTEEKYKEILAKGAKVAQDAIREEAPIGKGTHIIKDGGGRTKKVKAGNLKKSIQIFTFRGSNAVFSGAVTSKRSKIKKVKGHKLTRRNRAFYWKFIYYGAYNKAPNKFVDRAKKKSKQKVVKAVTKATKRALPRRLKSIFDKI